MNYTSPSPANVGLNGNQTTWWIPARNLSTKAVDNVVVTVTVLPTTGLAPVTYLADVGSFNFNTGKWNVGKLAAGATKWLKIVTSVSDIGLAPWTVTSVITGDGVDVNNVNNTLVQTLTSVVCAPTAGAVNDTGKCACIDVSENDQACNYGVSEWRLNPASVVNSTSYVWDTLTGKGNFTFINPTLSITGAYSLWCDAGAGFVEISGPATFEILPTLESIDVFNHTPHFIEGSELTPAEIIILQAQYPELANIADVCWNIIRNGDGVLTGGIPMNCSEEQDARAFFICTDEDCTVGPPSCISCPQSYLPNAAYTEVMDALNHEPEIGDTIFLQHPTGHSFHKWNGSTWERSGCGCISYESTNPYPTAVSVTGTTTKTVTITMSSGAPLTTTFTDLNTNTNTTYTLVPNAGNTAFDLVDNNNNVISTITFPATAGGDNWGTQVIEHASTSISSGDGTITSPLLVETCPNIYLDVLPQLGDVGKVYTLAINGISNASPLWNTWIWQYSDKYGGVGTNLNTNPTWFNGQTGGLTYAQPGDDTVIRVVLIDGNCEYYSNQSGYIPSVVGAIGSGITVNHIENSHFEIDYNPNEGVSSIYDQSWSISESSTINLSATTTPIKIPFNGQGFNLLSTIPQLLTVSAVNDNFTAPTQQTWSMEYTISYNQLSSMPVTYIVDMFKNGVAIGQPIKFTTPGTVDTYTPISRTGEFSINENDVFDFRVSVLSGTHDFTAENFNVVIRPLFYNV